VTRRLRGKNVRRHLIRHDRCTQATPPIFVGHPITKLALINCSSAGNTSRQQFLPASFLSRSDLTTNPYTLCSIVHSRLVYSRTELGEGGHRRLPPLAFSLRLLHMPGGDPGQRSVAVVLAGYAQDRRMHARQRTHRW